MKNNSIRKLTIVTVTFNRCYYIERLLTYYASNGFDQSIVIVDASDEKEAAINELLYSKMKKQLSLTVLWANGKTIIECLDRSLGVIATPYATINSDDDFLVPSTLDIMVNFLDNNDEYVGVNGSAVLLGEKVENGIPNHSFW